MIISLITEYMKIHIFGYDYFIEEILHHLNLLFPRVFLGRPGKAEKMFCFLICLFHKSTI